MSHLTPRIGATTDGPSESAPEIRLVQRFIASVNAKRVDRMLELMTVDHVFIDSLGTEVEGRSALREPWHRYLTMFPNYRIDATSFMHDGGEVAVFGTSSGTLLVDGALAVENRWIIPTAWRARVVRQKLASWQVFADNEPVRAVMRRAGLL